MKKMEEEEEEEEEEKAEGSSLQKGTSRRLRFLSS